MYDFIDEKELDAPDCEHEWHIDTKGQYSWCEKCHVDVGLKDWMGYAAWMNTENARLRQQVRVLREALEKIVKAEQQAAHGYVDEYFVLTDIRKTAQAAPEAADE